MMAHVLHWFGIHDYTWLRGGRRKCFICGHKQSLRPGNEWVDIE